MDAFSHAIAYATRNFQDEQAPHLWLDKKIFRRHFNLDGLHVLDFGCGMGGMTLWYASNWDCRVHGVDIDPVHIEVAQTLVRDYNLSDRVYVELRDVVEQPLNDTYDLITLNDVAEHIPLPVLDKILKQLSKVLKPNGRIIVSYPPWKSPYASHVYHAVKIPWCQFLPKPMLMKLIRRNNQPLTGVLEGDLVSAYEGLNHLTHRKLMRSASQANLVLTKRVSHSFFNKWKGLENVPLRFFPFDYFITKEVAVFQRG